MTDKEWDKMYVKSTYMSHKHKKDNEPDELAEFNSIVYFLALASSVIAVANAIVFFPENGKMISILLPSVSIAFSFCLFIHSLIGCLESNKPKEKSRYNIKFKK